MCSTPSIPQVKAADPVATPTYADAAVQKAGENTRTRAAALSSRNVKTSALGLTDGATVKKTRLGE